MTDPRLGGARLRAHHALSCRVSMPAPRLDHAVKAFEEAGSFDGFEPGDFTPAKLTLKYLDSLLQCPGTTVRIPLGWDSLTASIAISASIVDAGVAPSDFALNFLEDGDLRNQNYV